MISIAKRDKGNDENPPNEDEGKKLEDEQKFPRTSQALKLAKNAISDAKLYVYAKTGQIQESEDDAEVSLALMKLDTYKEQVDSLLKHADNWTKSMLQTWNHQTTLIDALNECNTVIHSFHINNKANDENDTQQSIDNDDDAKDRAKQQIGAMKSPFAAIAKGISTELYINQQESEKRYGHASKLLVVPLRNILENEIMHAVDIKRKYTHHKRQYDNCCTSISICRDKIEELDNPKQEEEDVASTSAFGKFKSGFNKLIQSNPTKEDLENKLNNARAELPKYMDVFEKAKKQLLESISIVEEKLNVEVVYYVQQFYSFVKQWKSANEKNQSIENEIKPQNIQNANNNNDNNNIEKTEEEMLAFAQQIINSGKSIVEKKEKFVSDLQIDSMMQINPEMQEVSLESPEVALMDNQENMKNADNGVQQQ